MDSGSAHAERSDKSFGKTAGNVHYEPLSNHGVATGHVIGDGNTIIGKLSLTVNKAKSVVEIMEMHAARLKNVDGLMKNLADRIRVTGSILSEVKALVWQTMEKNVRLSIERNPVKGLFEDVLRCETIFTSTQTMLEMIKKDFDISIMTNGKREKIELTPGKLEELRGTFNEIGLKIQDSKLNLHLRLSLFQQGMKGTDPTPEFNDMIADLWRDLRTLKAQTGKGQGQMTRGVIGKSPDHAQETDRSGNPYETWKFNPEGKKDDGTNDSMDPHYIQYPTPAREFPLRMISDYQPRYAGWRIKKGPDNKMPLSKQTTYSWKSPTVTQLLLSNEELYLEARGERLFLQDVLDDLSSEDKRSAIAEVMRWQNLSLKNWEPDLEWRMAGIRVRIRTVSRHKRETEHISVILKTELMVPPPPGWPLPHRVTLGGANPGMIRPSWQVPELMPVPLIPNNQAQQQSQPVRYSSLPNHGPQPSRRLPPKQGHPYDTAHAPLPRPPGSTSSLGSVSEQVMMPQAEGDDKCRAARPERQSGRENEELGSQEQEMMAVDEDRAIDDMLSEWQDAMSPANA